MRLWQLPLAPLVLIAVAPAVSGAPASLTRANAAQLIQADLRFAVADGGEAWLSSADLKLGIQIGLWHQEGMGGFLVVDPPGRNFFSDKQASPLVVRLREPLRRRVVQVTGIAGVPLGEGLKEAQFTWQYEGLPKWLQGRDGSPTAGLSGEAYFRLYDDGWRLDGWKAASDAALALVARNLPGVPEMERAAVLRAEQQASAAAATRERERVAKTPTRTVGRYEFVSCPGSYREERGVLEITDATVVVSRTKGGGTTGTFGFWDDNMARSAREGPAQNEIPCSAMGLGGKLTPSLRLFSLYDTVNPRGVAEAVVALRAAYGAWNARFPDRNTWIPAGPAPSRDAMAPRPAPPAGQTPAIVVGSFLGKWFSEFPSKEIKCFEVVAGSPPTMQFNSCGLGGESFSLPVLSANSARLHTQRKDGSRNEEFDCEIRDDGRLKMVHSLELKEGPAVRRDPLNMFSRDRAAALAAQEKSLAARAAAPQTNRSAPTTSAAVTPTSNPLLGRWVSDPTAMIKCIEVVSTGGLVVHFNNCGRGGAAFSLAAELEGSALVMLQKNPARDDEITCALGDDGNLKMLYEMKPKGGGKPSHVSISFSREGGGVLQAQGASQVAPPVAPPSSLGNAEVIDLIKAGLGPDLVVAKIKQSKASFDTSPGALKALKEAKVPDNVILAMIEAK